MSSRCFGVVVLVWALLPAAARPAKPVKDQAAKVSLKSGDVLPGAFQVFSVTGPRAVRFSCPVCEYGVKPFVLVFIRDAKNPDAVGKLLQGLDALVDKHPDARLGACAIFLEDGSYRKALAPAGAADEKELAKAIDDREALESRLRDWAGSAGAKLKHVAIGLDSPGGPEKYHLDAEAAATVLLCHKLKLAAEPMVFKDVPGSWDDVLRQVDKLATRAEGPRRPKR